MQIGKARIQFRSEGCVDCGGPAAPIAAHVAERIRVIVGDRRTYVELHRCQRCVDTHPSARRAPVLERRAA